MTKADSYASVDDGNEYWLGHMEWAFAVDELFQDVDAGKEVGDFANRAFGIGRHRGNVMVMLFAQDKPGREATITGLSVDLTVSDARAMAAALLREANKAEKKIRKRARNPAPVLN